MLSRPRGRQPLPSGLLIGTRFRQASGAWLAATKFKTTNQSVTGFGQRIHLRRSKPYFTATRRRDLALRPYTSAAAVGE